jgi:hypothetical protein
MDPAERRWPVSRILSSVAGVSLIAVVVAGTLIARQRGTSFNAPWSQLSMGFLAMLLLLPFSPQPRAARVQKPLRIIAAVCSVIGAAFWLSAVL